MAMLPEEKKYEATGHITVEELDKNELKRQHKLKKEERERKESERLKKLFKKELEELPPEEKAAEAEYGPDLPAELTELIEEPPEEEEELYVFTPELKREKEYIAGISVNEFEKMLGDLKAKKSAKELTIESMEAEKAKIEEEKAKTGFVISNIIRKRKENLRKRGILEERPEEKAKREKEESEEIKVPFDEESAFKSHYAHLDKLTQEFLETYFPGQEEEIGKTLLPGQLNQLNDTDFLDNVINEVNQDIDLFNSTILDAGDQYPKLRIDYKKYPLSDPNNLAAIATIMTIYKKQGLLDRLSFIMSFDPSRVAVMKKEDIKHIANKTHMTEMSPDKLADAFMETLNLNKPKDYEKPFDRLQEIKEEMDQAKNELENGYISQSDFDVKTQILYSELIRDYGKDPYFQRAQQSIAQRSIYDMNKLNDYLRQINAVIQSSPNNPVSINIKSLIDQTMKEVKEGVIDAADAFKSLNSIGIIKQAINEGKTSLDYELKMEEKEIEEIEEPIVLHAHKSQYYANARKEGLLGFEGIILKNETSIIPDDYVYNLDDTELFNLHTSLQKIDMDSNLTKNNYDDTKTWDDKNLRDFGEKLLNDLDDKGIKLDTSKYDLYNALLYKQPAEKIRKELKQFASDFKNIESEVDKLANKKENESKKLKNSINKEVGKIENQYKPKIEKLDDQIKTKIPEKYKLKLEEFDTNIKKYIDDKEEKKAEAEIENKKKLEEKIKLEIEEEENKKKILLEELKKKIEDAENKKIAAKKKTTATKLKKTTTSLSAIKAHPPTRKVKRAVPVIVPAPPAAIRNPPQPRIIIPAAEANRQAEKIKEFAEGVAYAAKTSKHEPARKKAYYGDYAIEYNITNKEDLLNMLREIRSMKGTLYIIDLASGRLFPIRKDKVFEGAIYVFQKDILEPGYTEPPEISSSITGGSFLEPIPKSHKRKRIPAELPANAPKRNPQKKREIAYYKGLRRKINGYDYERGIDGHGATAHYPALSRILKDEEYLFPYEFMRNGNDKALQMMHKLGKHKRKYDYRDQIRHLIGGSIWSSIKHGLKSAANDTKNYVVNKTVNAAKNLANQSVYEGTRFIQQERKNVKDIYKANKEFYRHPSLSNFGKAYNATTIGAVKVLAQPGVTAARELANVSDFASNVPGLNIVKFGLEYAIPPLAVADAAVHATKNLDEGKYLDAAINSMDAILGTGQLSGATEIGAKVLNTGLKVSDAIVDKHNSFT